MVENPEDTYQIEQIKRILSVDEVQFCPGIQEDIELLIEHFFEQGKKLEKIEIDPDKPLTKKEAMQIIEEHAQRIAKEL